jgi:hypothetical protein
MGKLKKLKQDSSRVRLVFIRSIAASWAFLFIWIVNFIFWIFLSQGYICNRFYCFRQCEQASDGGNKSCHMG